MTAGYSGTPLARKLSLKDGMRVWFAEMPDSVRTEIDAYGLTLSEEELPTPGLNAAHIFVTDRAGVGELAEKNREGRHGHHRGHHPRGRLADRLCRYQGVRGGHGLVGAETGDPQGTPLIPIRPDGICRNSEGWRLNPSSATHPPWLGSQPALG